MQDDNTIKEIAEGLGISTTDLLKRANTRVGIAGVRNDLIKVGFIDESLTDDDMFSIFGKTNNSSFKEFLDGSGYDVYDIQDKVEKDPLILLGLKKQLIAEGFIEDNVLSDEDWYNAFGMQMPKVATPEKKPTNKTDLPPIPKGFELSGNLIKNGDVLFKDIEDLNRQIKEVATPKTELDWTTGQSKTQAIDTDKLNKLKKTKSTYTTFLNNQKNYKEDPITGNTISFDLGVTTPTAADIRKELQQKKSFLEQATSTTPLQFGAPNTATQKKLLTEDQIKKQQEEIKLLEEREKVAVKVDALKDPGDFIKDNEKDFFSKFRQTGGNALASFNLQNNNINEQKSYQQSLMEESLNKIKESYGPEFYKDYTETLKNLNAKSEQGTITEEDIKAYQDKYKDFMQSPEYKDYQNYAKAYQKSDSFIKNAKEQFKEADPEGFEDFQNREEIYFNRDKMFADRPASRAINWLARAGARVANQAASTAGAIESVVTGNNTGARMAQQARNFGEYFPSTSRAEAGIERVVEFDYKGKKLKAVYDKDKVAYIRDQDDYIVQDLDGSITEYAKENTSKDKTKWDYSIYGLASQTADVVLDVAIDAVTTRGLGKAIGGTKAAYNTAAGMTAFSRGFGGTYNQLLETPGVSQEMATFGATVMGLAASQLTKINPLEADIAEKGFFNFANKFVTKNAERIAKGQINPDDIIKAYLSTAAKVGYTGAKEVVEELPELFIETGVVNPIINRVDGTLLEEEVDPTEILKTILITLPTGILGMGKLPTKSNMRKQAIEHIAQDLDTFIDFAEGLMTSNPDMTELGKYVTAARELKVISESPENRAKALDKLVELNQQKEELKSITIPQALVDKKEKIAKLEQELYSMLNTEQSGSSLGTTATLTNATGELGGDDVNTPPSLDEEVTPTPPERLIDVLNIEEPVVSTEAPKTPYQVQSITTDADGKETIQLIDATKPKDIDDNLFYHKDGNNFVITDKESGAEITRAKTLKEAKKNLEVLDLNGILKDQRKKAKDLGIKIEPPVGEQSTTDSGSVTTPAVSLNTEEGDTEITKNDRIAIDSVKPNEKPIKFESLYYKEKEDGTITTLNNGVLDKDFQEEIRNNGKFLNTPNEQKQQETKTQQKETEVRGETNTNTPEQTNEEVGAEEVLKSGISNKEYNDFIDKGIVTQDRINYIAEKVKNNEQLLERELLIFNDKTSEINQKLKELKALEENNKTQTNEESSKKDDNEKGSTQAKEGKMDSTLVKGKKVKPSKVSSKIKVGDTIPINGNEETIADVITDPDGTVYSVYTEEGTEVINPNYSAENKTWLIGEEPGITNIVVESLATTKEGIIEQIKDSILSQGVTEDYAEELAAARFAMWEAQADLQGIDGIEFMAQNIAAIATVTDQQYQEMQEAAQQKEEAKKVVTEALESGINEQQIESSNVNIYNNPDLLVEAYKQEALPGEKVQEFIKRKYCQY